MKTLLLAAAAAAVVVLGGSGCAFSPEDRQQQAARQTAEQWAGRHDGYTGEAHCTDSARKGWFSKTFTPDYVCAARRDDGECDWLVVHFSTDTGRITVTPHRDRAGCVLPV